MGALAANIDRDRKDAGALQQFPVSDGERIYEGALCCIDEDGYLVAATNVANRVLAGIAYEEGDNRTIIAGHADGAVKVRCYRRGIFKFASTALVRGDDMGIKMYATNDNTIDPSNVSDKVLVGPLVEYVDGSNGWVDIEPGCVVGALST